MDGDNTGGVLINSAIVVLYWRDSHAMQSLGSISSRDVLKSATNLALSIAAYFL